MRKFKVGTILLITGLYSGDYEEKIIRRTETEIICQELAFPDSEPNIHKIAIDEIHNTEYFINWEYKGERSLIYPYSTPEIVYRQNCPQRA